MSQAGLFSSSYSSQVLPCPAWTGTGGITAQYESSSGSSPTMRGGSRRRKRRTVSKRKRRGIYGGFIPRSYNIRSNPVKQTRRVAPKKTSPKYTPFVNVSRSGSQKNH